MFRTLNLCNISKYYKRSNFSEPLGRLPKSLEDISVFGQTSGLTLRLPDLDLCAFNKIAGLSIIFSRFGRSQTSYPYLQIEGLQNTPVYRSSPTDDEIEQIQAGQLSYSLLNHGLYELISNHTIESLKTNTMISLVKNAALKNSELTTPICFISQAGIQGSIIRCNSSFSGYPNSALIDGSVTSPRVVNSGLKANSSIFNTNQYLQIGGSLFACTIAASSVILAGGNIFDSSIFFHELTISSGHTNSSFMHELWPEATDGGLGAYIYGDQDGVPTFGDKFYLQCSGLQLSGPIKLNGVVQTDYLYAEYLGLDSSGTIITNICETYSIDNMGIMNIDALDLKIKNINNSGTLLVESLYGEPFLANIMSLKNHGKFTCNETGTIRFGLINNGIVSIPSAKTCTITTTSATNNLPSQGINFQVLSAPNALLSLNTIINNVSGNIIATAIVLSNSKNHGNINSTQDVFVLEDSINQPFGLIKATDNIIFKDSTINNGNIQANQIQFFDQSINFANIQSNINNPILFNNTTINSGNLLSATFRNNSINYGSIKQAIFDNQSVNFADIIMSDNNEKIVFIGVSVNEGTITNSGSYNNLIFEQSSGLSQRSVFYVPTNSGVVYKATFKDSSINYGNTIDCHFRDKSANASGYNLSPSFFDKAINEATQVVSGKFYNTSINSGYVTSGIFYDNSRNVGSGEALSFYDSSQNLNLSTVAYFYPNSINHWDGGRVTQSVFYNSINSGICTVNPERGGDILREKTIFSGSNARNMGECIDGQFYFLEGAQNGNFLSVFLTQNDNGLLPIIAQATDVYFNNSINYGLIIGSEKCSFDSGSSNYGMIAECNQIIFSNNSTNNIGLKFYDPGRYSINRDITDRWSSRDFGYAMIKDTNTVIFSNAVNKGAIHSSNSINFIDGSINEAPLNSINTITFNNSINTHTITSGIVYFNNYSINHGIIIGEAIFDSTSVNSGTIIPLIT